MAELLRSMAGSFGELIPAGRHRWQAIALILIGTAIPVTELLVTQMFAEMITTTTTHTRTVASLAPELGVFCALFLGTRLAHYGQRIYRVRFFERAFGSSPRGTSASIESWEWAQAMELMNILTLAAQLVVIAGFVTLLAPIYGAANALLLVLLAEALGRIFVRQRDQQLQFVARRRAGEHVSPHTRLRSRVASAELGGFLSSVAVVVLLVALIGMNLAGMISAASTLVLFLGLRMQNTAFAGLSGGLMRMARAQANTM